MWQINGVLLLLLLLLSLLLELFSVELQTVC